MRIDIVHHTVVKMTDCHNIEYYPDYSVPEQRARMLARVTDAPAERTGLLPLGGCASDATTEEPLVYGFEFRERPDYRPVWVGCRASRDGSLVTVLRATDTLGKDALSGNHRLTMYVSHAARAVWYDRFHHLLPPTAV